MSDGLMDLGVTPNNAKAKLASGGYAFGTSLQLIRTPSLVRMIAIAGFDLVFLDMEHSSFGWELIADMCDTARSAGIAPIVRPYDLDPRLLNRVLDIGAMGLMCRDITERSQVESIFDVLHYPPRGHRGVTTGSPPTDYRVGNGRDLQDFVTANTLLVIQIESREGVDNLDSILSGGGVDVVEVGRNDLSTDLGVPQQTRHPKVLAALDEIIAICARHGVAAGVNGQSPDEVGDLFKRGVRCLSYSGDKRILQGAYREGIEFMRGLVASTGKPA